MLPTIEPVVLWRGRTNVGIAAEHLVELLDEHDDMDRESLFRDPIAALSDCSHIQLLPNELSASACGLFGSYSSNPPTIRYRRSAVPERDSFTVLHELGHHLQRNDRPWAFDVLAVLPSFDRRLLEEDVASAFASRVLIPDVPTVGLSSQIDSAFVSDLHRKSRASRRAVLVRSIELAGQDPLVLAIVDSGGTIRFSVSSADELPMLPARSIQPDLARLLREGARSTEGTVRGRAEVGIRYSSGATRSDLAIDITMDWSGTYAFVAIRPTYRFGDRDWDSALRECPSPACEEVYVWNAESEVCRNCAEPRCPACRTCGCERKAGAMCGVCFMELSMADVAAGRSTHDDC